MISNNRRKADRVDVCIPAQIHTRAGPVVAEVLDLSRTGLRVRFPLSALRKPCPGDPKQVAACAAELLSPTFELDMHFERFGSLLNRCVTPICVGIPTDADDMLEVCCEFEEAFEDEECGYLDLSAPLPPMRDNVDVWVDIEPEPEPQPADAPAEALAEAAIAGVPRQRYRALVSSFHHDAPPSWFCHTNMVTHVGVRVLLPRKEAGIPSGGEVAVSGALAILIASYGAAVELRIVDQGGDIWNGPARISGVELPRERPNEVLVTLAFGRGLSLGERRALDLIGDAA